MNKLWKLGVLLLLLLVHPYQIQSHPEGAMIRLTQIEDESSIVDSNISLDLPFYGEFERSQSISSTSPMVLENITAESSLEATVHVAEYDLIGYANLSQLTHHVEGAHHIEFNEETGITSISINDTSYLNTYELIIDEPIDNTEEFRLDLKSLDFDVLLDKIAYFSIDVYFDELIVNFIYYATPSYQSFIMNATGQVKLYITHFDPTEVSLSQLVDIAGSSLPTKLEKISFTSYANDVHSLDIEFEQISLVRNLNSPDLVSLGMVLPQTIAKGDQYTIIPDYRYSVYATIQREVRSTITAIGTLNISNTIYFTGQINPIPISQDFDHYIILDQTFSDTNLTHTAGFNGSHHLVNDGETIFLSGTLIQLDDLFIATDRLVQGLTTRISMVPHTDVEIRLFHEVMDEVLEVHNNTVLIPRHWSKGEVLIYGIYRNGSYGKYATQLQFSPASLAMEKEIELEPTRELLLPIILRNITSTETFNPSLITSFKNGSLYGIDSSLGLRIDPDEFEDFSVLSVNATHPGFVPVVFDLTIRVSEFVPSVLVTARRSTSSNATVEIVLTEYFNWTSKGMIQLRMKDEVFTQEINGPVTVFELFNSSWIDNQSYQFQFSIELYSGRESAVFEGTIPAVVPPDETLMKENTNPVITASVLSFGLFSLTGVGIKLYKERVNNKILSF